MKAKIDVSDTAERDALQAAMADPTTRACVLVMGHLLALPSDNARLRVLRFVEDRLQSDEPALPLGS